MTSARGWDIASGKQLWRLAPTRPNDFNVTTPIVFGEMLVVATENNGTRLYRFDKDGIIVPRPVAVNDELAPDTHTPVALGTRLFGVWRGLHCLDLANGLQPIWKAEDKAFDDYATAIACGDRVLILSKHGELLLVDAAADQYHLISRMKVFEDDQVAAHTSLPNRRSICSLRGTRELFTSECSISPAIDQRHFFRAGQNNKPSSTAAIIVSPSIILASVPTARPTKAALPTVSIWLQSRPADLSPSMAPAMAPRLANKSDPTSGPMMGMGSPIPKPTMPPMMEPMIA